MTKSTGKHRKRREFYSNPVLGTRFGRLVVTGETIREGEPPVRRVPCICDCGTERRVDIGKLYRGGTLSCGCYQVDVLIATRRNDVEVLTNKAALLREQRHGLSNHPLYNVWSRMKARCFNPNDKDYRDYGGRGISVCSEWRQNFEAFFEWAIDAGYETGLEIDRIDNDGSYSPDNCRWATRGQQLRNTRYTRYLTCFGETKPMADWPYDPRCPVDYNVLNRRISSRGWDDEKAITTPMDSNKSRTVGPSLQETILMELNSGPKDLDDFMGALEKVGYQFMSDNPRKVLRSTLGRLVMQRKIKNIRQGVYSLTQPLHEGQI